MDSYEYLKQAVTLDRKIKLDMDDDITKSILVTHNNEIVHEGAREAMGI